LETAGPGKVFKRRNFIFEKVYCILKLVTPGIMITVNFVGRNLASGVLLTTLMKDMQQKIIITGYVNAVLMTLKIFFSGK
jgi:hypothetical protein